jgi:hypothetical protein
MSAPWSNYRYQYLFTPWSRSLLEELVLVQSVKKSMPFMEPKESLSYSQNTIKSETSCDISLMCNFHARKLLASYPTPKKTKSSLIGCLSLLLKYYCCSYHEYLQTSYKLKTSHAIVTDSIMNSNWSYLRNLVQTLCHWWLLKLSVF